MRVSLHSFADGAALAASLAALVANRLDIAIATRGAASLAVSGGRTPVRFLEALATKHLSWDRVTVTLVDDRWVPASSGRSNERLVRDHLLQGRAAAARFVPLVHGGATPEDDRDAAESALARIPWPLAIAVLGMGDDGHTASFFPGGDRLDACLDPGSKRKVETLRAPAAGEPRITLTLPALLASCAIALHIEGASKSTALALARAGGPEADMPIRAVLERADVDVFRCP